MSLSDLLWACVLHSKYNCDDDILPRVKPKGYLQHNWIDVDKAITESWKMGARRDPGFTRLINVPEVGMWNT